MTLDSLGGIWLMIVARIGFFRCVMHFTSK